MSSAPIRLQYIEVVGGDNAQGTFAAVRLNAHTLVGIITPSVWTAANLTFRSGDKIDLRDDSTINYFDVYDVNGTEYTVTAAASRYIILEPQKSVGLGWVIVRSGTTGTPVQQAAARTLILVVRPVS